MRNPILNEFSQPVFAYHLSSQRMKNEAVAWTVPPERSHEAIEIIFRWDADETVRVQLRERNKTTSLEPKAEHKA